LIANSTCALLFFFALFTVAPARGQNCPGDCSGDGQVSIDELVLGVRIALGSSVLADCPSFDSSGDGRVAVSELVAAVAAALGDCVADTPTPTPTRRPACGDAIVDVPEECDDGGSEDGDGCSAACELEPGGDVCNGVAASSTDDYLAAVVADGFEFPVHVAAPPLDPNRLFVVEQAGTVWVLRRTEDGWQRQATPYVDLTLDVAFSGSSFDERGLLTIAFHPDFESNGWFFLNYTCSRARCPDGVAGNSTVVARFEVDPDADVADVASRVILFTAEQPFTNHNGGQLAFAPDGTMFVGMGDGGSGGDPLENAQSDDTVLGKMLRLDVDVAAPPYWRVPEDNPNPIDDELGLIWAKGLRNPWRFSFDRETGDLYMGDVGQNSFEEINVQPAASSGGENYGWDIFEGRSCFEPEPPAQDCPGIPNDFVLPVLQYGRTEGISVTGGFVYRGCVLDSLQGTYLYADFGVPGLRSFVLLDGTATSPDLAAGRIAVEDGRDLRSVASFGEDARGEIYVVDRSGGEIFQLLPRE